MLWGLKVEDFPLDKITSIQYHTGMIFGTRTIFASGNKAEIKQVEKASARSFAEGARARLSATVSKPQSTAVDVVSEIERLGQLKEKGLLTEEEFAAGKRRLLGA